MSRADIERFVADLKSDPALLEQVKSGSTGLASVVDMAKAKGYDISIDEAKAYIDEQAHAELSDAQLDAVAGGKSSAVTSTTAVQTTTVVTTALGVAEITEGVGVGTTVGAVVEVVAAGVVVAT